MAIPNRTELLADIDLLYPNTYTAAQKILWMDKAQKEIFQEAMHEGTPYTFNLALADQWYAPPADCDVDNIIKVTIETSLDSGEYDNLAYVPFINADLTSSESEWYTTFEDQIFINPSPAAADVGRNVYLYYYKRPETLASGAEQTPDLHGDFHDLLVFAVIIKMAKVRGDISLAMNYIADYNLLLKKYLTKKKDKMPTYPVTQDVMKKRHKNTKQRRADAIYDLMP